jgi:hypothetical protein
MKRPFRNAFNALKKLGVPVREYHEDKYNFWISAEDSDSYKWCDYYDEYRMDDWEFGVHPLIRETLKKYGLFAEWENPAQLSVWEN